MAIDRRGFLKGALGMGVLAAAGVTAGGCAPSGKGGVDANAAVNGTFEGVGQGMQGDIT